MTSKLGKVAGESGITYSMESGSDEQAEKAEYDVLKSIIARENYLQRLQQAVRTIEKNFKPEIADILDLIRIATVDVVEAIQHWAEVKNEPNKVFMWNGFNYMLKIPSDLDFLSDFLAIQRWAGFTLIRNPFCVPYPMEAFLNMNSANVVDPQNMQHGSSLADGIRVGNPMHKVKVQHTYSSKSTQPQSPYQMTKGKTAPKPSKPKQQLVLDENEGQSFIFNEELRRIRRAEGVILNTESKFGSFSRDPNGHLVPYIQALTRKAATELKKDDHRPLSDPSETTLTFAPHAARCDIGLAQVSWAPVQGKAKGLKEDLEFKTAQELQEKHLQQDQSVAAYRRGQSKLGGTLASMETRGSETRPRRPLKPTISTAMDFGRYRKIQSLGERLNELNKIREELNTARSMKLNIDPHSTIDQPITHDLVLTAKEAMGEKTVEELPSNTFAMKSKLDKIANRSPLKTKIRAAVLQAKSKKQKAHDHVDEQASTVHTEETEDKAATEYLDKMKEVLQLVEGLDERKLMVEEAKAQRQLNQLMQDEGIIRTLKASEREKRNVERSREIERKRRLLASEENKREGPPPEDLPNIYDYYATRIQSGIRGWLVRCWVSWYRDVSTKAVTIMQSLARGFFARLKVRRMKTRNAAATKIQKIFRGWNSRGTSAAMAKKKNLTKNAITIQRVWRGVLGQRRAVSKRALDNAAKEAFDAVDSRFLAASDVKELAHRVIYAIEEPTTTSFPPDEVLYLIRLSTLVMTSARGGIGLTDYNFYNAREYEEVTGEELDWKQTAKILNRSERFIRLVRTLAFGPGAKPPRLIQLSPQLNLLLDAQTCNPKWALETFQNIGKGSRICVQLFKWLTSMVDISKRQQQFLNLIATSFPDWLPKMLDFQRQCRHYEFEMILNQKCLDLLNDHKVARENDEEYVFILDRDIKLIKKTIKDSREKLKKALVELEKLKTDQASREALALTVMESRVADSVGELEKAAEEMQHLTDSALAGDRAAQEELIQFRNKVTMLRLKMTELDGQRKLLEIQVDNNRAKRKNPVQLTSEIITRAIIAGESRAAHVIAQVDSREMLRSAGVKFPHDLPTHLSFLYEDLVAVEEEKRAVARKLFLEADRERQLNDDIIQRSATENDLKEQKNKNKMSPNEDELEEERIEDEKEAVEERRKHMQYLPDHVLHSYSDRARPVIIAISRDVPGCAKQNMIKEITKSMPGLFIYLNFDENLGVNVAAIQSAFDASKSVIMHVDYGLTRATRASFVNILEVMLKGLIPMPRIIMAVGSESNMKGEVTNSEYGVDIDDIKLSRDGEIKICLEIMAQCYYQLRGIELRRMAQMRSVDVLCKTRTFEFVLEAVFILCAENQVYRRPDPRTAGTSWRLTRHLMISPEKIIERMRNYRRGQSSKEEIDCFISYCTHHTWPLPDENERMSDPLLNCLATYVEFFVKCEVLSEASGGAPLQSFTKNTITGLEAVIYVSDRVHENTDLNMIPKRHGYHWTDAINLLLRAALQDLRVAKSVFKIPGVNSTPLNKQTSTYTVSVYREKSIIYFDAYDSNTSEFYFTTVSVYDVPALIVPNSSQDRATPPNTPDEMYGMLLKLLRFVNVKSGFVHQQKLVCRRDYVLIYQATRKINGHRTIIKSFEAALGELFFMGYLPEYSKTVEVLVGPEDIRILHKYIRDDDNSGEDVLLHSTDAQTILPFIFDRLRITPSKAIYESLLVPVVRRGGGAINFVRDRNGFYSRGDNIRLRAKMHGALGRVLCRIVKKLDYRMTVVEVRASSPKQLLLVRVYERDRRKTLNLYLNRFLRLALVGSDADDYFKWKDKLIQRLHVDWTINIISVNRIVASRVAKFSGKYMIICYLALTEEETEVEIIDQSTSTSYKGTLTIKQLQGLLALNSESTGGGNSLTNNQRNILHHMDGKLKSTNNDQSQSKDENALRFMLELYGNMKNISKVTQELSRFLVMSKDASLLKTERCVVQAKFELKTEPPHQLTDDTHIVDNNVDTDNSALIDKGNVKVKYNSWRRIRRNVYTVDSMNSSPSDNIEVSPIYGDTMEVIYSRAQAPIVQLENALDIMAHQKAKEASERTTRDTLAGFKLGEYLDTLRNNAQDISEHNVDIVEYGVQETMNEVVSVLYEEIIDNLREKNFPGQRQERLLSQFEEVEQPDQVATDETQPEDTIQQTNKNEENDAIVENEVKKVMERGIKIHFREGKVRWQGHVNVKVFSATCWTTNEGVGKRYMFHVFEPVVAQEFIGTIRSKKHLKEVLGLNAQDLVNPIKESEMLMFICRYRLDLVINNKTTWDGEVAPSDAPPYRVEFQSDRFFGADKVTPVNAEGNEDEQTNNKKLMDIENARGRKIVRIVRRVSGLLMQLTVFELPASVAKASMTGYVPSQPELLGLTSIDELTRKQLDITEEEANGLGFAELRGTLNLLKKPQPPALRIVGYDPRSKRKVALAVSPQAVLEVCGGVFSPYLDVERRKELARVVTDALILSFPSTGVPFELSLPWSGAANRLSLTTAEIPRDKKQMTMRSSAERVIQRSGRIFRSGLRISKYDLIVSVYVFNTPDRDGVQAHTKDMLIFNFYSTALSQAAEIMVDGQQQIERVGKLLMSCQEGAVRATMIRRFCRFFRAEMIEELIVIQPKVDVALQGAIKEEDNADEDIQEKILKQHQQQIAMHHTKRKLDVVLMPPDKDYIPEYQMISVPPPGEDIRPVGYPGVFFPLDTCGKVLHRRGIKLMNRDSNPALIQQKDFLVTVHTKSLVERPERGFVIKLYDRATSQTSILHLGPSVLMQLLDKADEPDLLRDLITSEDEDVANNNAVDDIERGFKSVTPQGEHEEETNKLLQHVINIVLDSLGFYLDAQDSVLPYIKDSYRLPE